MNVFLEMDTQDRLNSIDFVKGFAALSVILLHTLPLKSLFYTGAVYHIWQAVPLFFFISFFLGFRRLEKNDSIKNYYSWVKIKKLFCRLWLPYICLAFLQTLLFYLKDGEIDFMKLFCIHNGPGSYYIWCYMQIWALLPLLFLLLKHNGLVIGAVVLFVFSLLGDFFGEFLGLDWPGLCCARYLFLSVVAYMYLIGIDLRKIRILIIISIIYLAFMVVHEFYNILPVWADPFFPDGWERQTSLGYFYTLFIFVVLTNLYSKIKDTKIATWFVYCGKRSWEIFIAQMFLLGSGFGSLISSVISNYYIQEVLLVLTTGVLSVCFAVLYDRFVLVNIKIS